MTRRRSTAFKATEHPLDLLPTPLNSLTTTANHPPLNHELFSLNHEHCSQTTHDRGKRHSPSRSLSPCVLIHATKPFCSLFHSTSNSPQQKTRTACSQQVNTLSPFSLLLHPSRLVALPPHPPSPQPTRPPLFHSLTNNPLVLTRSVYTGPVSENDFFKWSCLISGPSDTPFEGGVFEAEMTFPRDYPLSPPKVNKTPLLFRPFVRTVKLTLSLSWATDEVQPTFVPSQQYASSLRARSLSLSRFSTKKLISTFSPTVYASGDVCISILHAPGDDPNAYESSNERWSPVQSVEKILLSVISMLAGTFPFHKSNNLLLAQRKLTLRFVLFVAKQNPTSSREPTLMLAYAPRELSQLTKGGQTLTFYHLPLIQKVFRDNREQYDEIIRSHVRQQLDI